MMRQYREAKATIPADAVLLFRLGDFYEAIKDGVKEEADKIELKAGNLLALTTRLRQATACPSVLTTQDVESIKVNRAFEYINS